MSLVPEKLGRSIVCDESPATQLGPVTKQSLVKQSVRVMGSTDWFYFTAVYASPSVTTRKHMWNLLENVNTRSNVAWILGAEFNSTLSNVDYSGGASLESGINALFSDFVFNQGFIDAGFLGSRFTWRRGNLYKRLDRYLINDRTAQCMPFSILHLDHLGSDHRPILFQPVISSWRPTQRPFRFLACWQDHPNFREKLAS
ncbi:hypothetical protein V6N13_125740 [Hibiscus sabdariffa]